MTTLRDRLAAGPARGLGCAAEVAAEAVRETRRLRELVGALPDLRPVVVTRASNALKKVQAASPRALDPFAGELILAALTCEVLRARWSLLLVVARVRLTANQRAVVVDLLMEAMGSDSALERAHAMQALSDVAGEDAGLSKRVRELVERAMDDSSAAVRARARRLSGRNPHLQRSRIE